VKYVLDGDSIEAVIGETFKVQLISQLRGFIYWAKFQLVVIRAPAK
jgi:hypothetical protein